jgi:hypothetical protein
MLLIMGPRVLGKEQWKKRGLQMRGRYEDMLNISDETLIAWTVDGQWNGWCKEYGAKSSTEKKTRRKVTPRGVNPIRNNTLLVSERAGNRTETTEEQAVINPMEKYVQNASNDPEDWLNYGRPGDGPWFVKKAMEAGFKRKNGGTSTTGKQRWNYWYKAIRARRAVNSSDDKARYSVFCTHFQDSWEDMYSSNADDYNNQGGDGSVDEDPDTMEAMNDL